MGVKLIGDVHLKHLLTGTAAFVLIILNLIILFIPFSMVLGMKIVSGGHSGHRKILGNWLIAIARLFNHNNAKVLSRFGGMKWSVEIDGELKRNGSYLVVANHQAWTDILVLQKVLEPQIPFLKFFIKDELKWIPLLGLCWWGLDYPFMKRYSKEYLTKHPDLKGQDIAKTKQMCELFKDQPLSVVNFMEGARFSDEKRNQQQSPFKHLLKPKAGGAGITLTCLGEELNKLVDVAIHYKHNGDLSIWKAISGQIQEISVIISVSDIPEPIRKGNYESDPQYQNEVKAWTNQLWEEKDKHLIRLTESIE